MLCCGNVLMVCFRRANSNLVIIGDIYALCGY